MSSAIGGSVISCVDRWGKRGRNLDAEDNYFKIEGPSLGKFEASNRGTATLPELLARP